MPLFDISPEQTFYLPRGSAVVVIPICSSHDLFVQCIESTLKYTPQDIPIVIADDASHDPAIHNYLRKLNACNVLSHNLYYLSHQDKVGFVNNINTVFNITAPADVVILNSDCVVGDNWLTNLQRAAKSDSLAATVSTFTNHSNFLSLLNRNHTTLSLPQDSNLDTFSNLIVNSSTRTYPRIPTANRHCMYINRSALELVGYFDESFSPWCGVEVDFSQRCLLSGLSNIVADDVFVLHQGSGSFTNNEGDNVLLQSHDNIISERYSYYDQWIDNTLVDDTEPLSRTITMAKTAIQGLSLTIDARCLTKYPSGTQIYTLELINALSRAQIYKLSVVVPTDLGKYAKSVLSSIDNIQIVRADRLNDSADRAAIVHRPFQVSSYEDIGFLDKLGERIVISYHDLISYDNPGYHHSFHEWMRYRDLTKVSLSIADKVIFNSKHVAKMAINEEIVSDNKAIVVYLGTDNQLPNLVKKATRPKHCKRIDSSPFLLCLGTDFRHKNRLFALKILRELIIRHNWDGYLVFAGAHVAEGSSTSQEVEFIARNKQLKDRIINLNAITEEEKAWLYSKASAILYPTVVEGFGIMPFEAAYSNIPCIFPPQASLAEIFPTECALIVPWDEKLTSDNIFELMNSEENINKHVSALKRTASLFTWDRAASNLIDIYRTVIRQPAVDSTILRKMITNKRSIINTYYREKHGFSDDDIMLVGSTGSLPNDVKRPLLALSQRRWLYIIYFNPIKLLYKISIMIKRLKRKF